MAAAQALKSHRTDLLNIADSAPPVVTQLLSQEIMPEPTKDRILTSNLPQLKKSEALLEAIEARIIIKPQVFHTVVKLLEAEPTTQKLAVKLRNSYRKFCPYG